MRWLMKIGLGNMRSEAKFLTHSVSDHAPVLINLGKECKGLPKPFWYFNYRANLPRFNDIKRIAWEGEYDGSAMFKLSRKLQNTKAKLRAMG